MIKIIKIINRHILYFAVICLFIFIITYFNIGCPFLRLFGIPCPTCGVTRAAISLIKGDLKGYWEYHPLAVPMIFSVLLMLHIRKFKHQREIYVFVVSVLLLNLGLYIIRFLLN